MRDETAEGYRKLAMDALDAYRELTRYALIFAYALYFLGGLIGFLLGRST